MPRRGDIGWWFSPWLKRNGNLLRKVDFSVNVLLLPETRDREREPNAEPSFPYTAMKLSVRLVRSCLLGQEFQHHMFYTL